MGDYTLVAATPAHRPLLRQLFELYCHDFSPYTRSDVEVDGRWTPADFLDPWPAPPWRAFLFKVNEHWAGFAWVTRGSYVAPETEQATLMEEFFILRKYRRQRVGEHFATQLFEQFAGPWEIGEILENQPAQVFWRAILARYAPGRWREVVVDNVAWQGPVQLLRA